MIRDRAEPSLSSSVLPYTNSGDFLTVAAVMEVLLVIWLHEHLW